MAEWGGKLPGVSADELVQRLRETDDDGTAVKRLFVSIAYKRGIAPAEFERTFGIPEATAYRWLDRLEERGLDAGLAEDPRPGRPPKLSESGRARLHEALSAPPTDEGYDAPEWTPALVRDWLARELGVEYSRRHVRRLVEESTPEPGAARGER